MTQFRTQIGCTGTNVISCDSANLGVALSWLVLVTNISLLKVMNWLISFLYYLKFKNSNNGFSLVDNSCQAITYARYIDSTYGPGSGGSQGTPAITVNSEAQCIQTCPGSTYGK